MEAVPSEGLAPLLEGREPAQVRELVSQVRRLVLTYKFGIDEIMTKVSILRDRAASPQTSTRCATCWPARRT
ncbi:hypothetical protein [Isoptericola variabilis]|uniref:hypothetical protein n=1 Tax=Isoptericola variabilis TaxID=139208 RepID=UPI0002DFDED8|nr:hypothetical protein L600_000400000080 [Isoptericola variabilis J7]